MPFFNLRLTEGVILALRYLTMLHLGSRPTIVVNSSYSSGHITRLDYDKRDYNMTRSTFILLLIAIVVASTPDIKLAFRVFCVIEVNVT